MIMMIMIIMIDNCDENNIDILFFVYLQIEDAMLMFDKTTNRHRGKNYFDLSALSDLSHTGYPGTTNIAENSKRHL